MAGRRSCRGPVAGPAFGGVLADVAGTNMVFLSSAVPSILPLLVMRRLARVPAVATAAPPPVAAGAASSAAGTSWFSGLHRFRMPELRLTFALSFLIIVALDVRHSFLPLYVSSAGYSKSGIGAMLSILAACGIIVRPLTGWLIHRLDSWRLLTVAVVIALPAFMLIPTTGRAIWIAIAMGAVGLSFGLTQPLTMSLTAEASPPGERGVAMGLRMSAQRLSMLISPVLLGALAATLGLGAAFVGAGLFELAALGVAWRGARLVLLPAQSASRYS